MEIIQLLIRTDSIHIRVDAIAGCHAKLSKRQAFPLSQRVYDLSLCLTHIFDGEGHRAFNTVQVIVDA